MIHVLVEHVDLETLMHLAATQSRFSRLIPTATFQRRFLELFAARTNPTLAVAKSFLERLSELLDIDPNQLIRAKSRDVPRGVEQMNIFVNATVDAYVRHCASLYQMTGQCARMSLSKGRQDFVFDVDIMIFDLQHYFRTGHQQWPVRGAKS